MNPHLSQLHPYPFEKLAELKHGITPPADKSPIVLSIGEPAHATPAFIKETLVSQLQGLSNYPTTKGILPLRQAIADWIARRFSVSVNAETQVLPVSGTREALFSFAQCVIDATIKPVVIMPNPFYQIYEGAALLAGAEPYFLNTTEATDYLPDFDNVPEAIWQRCQLIYVCSPANPSGAVMSSADYAKLLQLAERYDFVIASDECYSELYDDERNPPVGLLEVAQQRSNAPGLRSGFVAGDAEILQHYFQYRTYQGCAMPLPTQYASIRAWQDEAHVIENRRLYREKFAAFIDILADVCEIKKPAASFYVWLKIPARLAMTDTEFTKQLFAEQNVTVLAGSFLSRDFNGINPGLNHVRIALVAPLLDCIEAANRIKNFLNHLNK
ncbi:MAG: succinyldiaminopimelate transaminase [Methylococcaceae bacterium]|nr:succinyldiaminopimelate transaminase [Methylococcaceae bacterium]